jgi:hypothetical protein
MTAQKQVEPAPATLPDLIRGGRTGRKRLRVLARATGASTAACSTGSASRPALADLG